MTAGLAFATLPFGLALGLGAALAKDSRSAMLRHLGDAYSTIFRGLPEILTLILIYYGPPILFQNLSELTGLLVAVEIPPFPAAVTALALVFGAYSSEVFLSAMRAVDRGQTEAARSLGMGSRLVFVQVMAPQMLRIALPGLGNNWLVLLKDTSLVSVIALDDLLRKTSIAVESTRQPFKFYAVACLLYLALTAVSTVVLAKGERASRAGWKSMT